MSTDISLHVPYAEASIVLLTRRKYRENFRILSAFLAKVELKFS